MSSLPRLLICPFFWLGHVRLSEKDELHLAQYATPMSGEEDNLSEFLKGFGFDEEELASVSDELDSFRTIPGTTIKRYMNRIMNTIEEEEDRQAFLKGILVGVAIRKAAEDLEMPDPTEEERRIDREIEKLGFQN
jgi:hypothetical protein